MFVTKASHTESLAALFGIVVDPPEKIEITKLYVIKELKLQIRAHF